MSIWVRASGFETRHTLHRQVFQSMCVRAPSRRCAIVFNPKAGIIASMKQSLQLKVGQSLTMTPQLQQAIRLLQLSSLEMQVEIQQTLDSNPLLELDEDQEDDLNDGDQTVSADPTSQTDAADAADAQADTDMDDVADSDWQDAIPDDLPVDSSWDDVYTHAATPPAGGGGDDDFDIDARNSADVGLHEHLHWQLNLTHLSERDQLIASTLIDSVDNDGLLASSLEDIQQSFDPEMEVELDEIVAVLHLLQRFDPTGVCARDLRECLLLQLAELPTSTRWRNQAITLIRDHMALLGQRDYAGLTRKMRLPQEDLADVIRLVQTLNPRPGASLQPDTTEYVVPDVIVRRRADRWSVELNPDAMPRLRINATYAGMVRRADSSADNQFLKDNLQEARWFLKSLQSRQETLLKVVTCIVEHQREFLEHGPEAMKPLVLHDIADATGMHESTISRVTTRKYMHTPRGVFELKYFFSSHVGTTTGGEVSSTAIRALIRKLTDEEDPRKPLSDSRIAQLLKEQDINVARRTIAKYRESMAIPPSNERKRLV